MIESLIGQAAAGAVGMGLDYVGTNIKNKQQYEQAEKLQGLQMEGSKEMAEYNANLAYDMWTKTNYSAQRKELEKAGLNPALLYGKSGGGGATTSAGAGGNVSGQQANTSSGMGLQLGMQMAITEAQIELTKAQADAARADAEKKRGVDTDLGKAQINNLNANSTAREIENAYLTEPSTYSYKNLDGEVVVISLTGIDQRHLNDIAQREGIKVKAQLDKIKADQLPSELANETNKVAIEAGKLNVMWQNAKTEQERVKLQEAMNGIIKEYNEGTLKLKNEQFDREGWQYWTDKAQHNIDNTISVLVPWYTPPTQTSHWENTYDDGQGGKTREGGSTIKRGKR